MKSNPKAVDTSMSVAQLAGGFGARAAVQSPEMQLRRSVMACLLWENLAYEDGKSVVENIKALIPQVDPKVVASIAVEARMKQKLRHVPLLIVREMARLTKHKPFVADTLYKVIQRADELAEFLAIYWKDGKCPISNQVKKGLARAFTKFNAYQLAKYNRDNVIKLRDVLFLCHAKPIDQAQAELWKALIDDKLPTPDTWETELSAGKDKAETFTRLIDEGKLGALAFVRNLRNMIQSNVKRAAIIKGFETINPRWLVPLDLLKAADFAPDYIRELDQMLLNLMGNAPKLPGTTYFVLDVSGSMRSSVSEKSQYNRQEAGTAMCVLAAGICEHVVIYLTAGSDSARTHKTMRVTPYQGFSLKKEIERLSDYRIMGGGGIFTRQCLEWMRDDAKGEVPDRIIIFSDSQDCDVPDKRKPVPFGKYNYIVDVSAHQNGVNYHNVWDAEISGWSEHFLKYILAFEGIEVPDSEE
jgi:hypothetical protein